MNNEKRQFKRRSERITFQAEGILSQWPWNRKGLLQIEHSKDRKCGTRYKVAQRGWQELYHKGFCKPHS